MVRTVTLNDGTKMPSLGWGNMGSKDKAVKAGAVALKSGIVHIDSAQVYGTEAEIILAIKEAGMKREDVYVTTKLRTFEETSLDLEGIRASVKRSLDKLTFIPNLLLIHNPFIPSKAGLSIAEFWAHLETLVGDGTLKGCSLGLSNFRPSDVEEVMKVAKIKPVVNQIEYHPYVMTHIEPLLQLQAKHNIITQSYAALTPVHRHPTGGPLKPYLTKLAEQLSKESGQEIDEAGVLILWVVCKGEVCVTSSNKEERIKSMAATEKVRDLTKEEIAEIDRLGNQVHFRHWTEHMTTDMPSPNLPQDA